MEHVNIFWFRRDLRLDDNCGLFNALQSGVPVLPLFIFDVDILDKLNANDRRLPFFHQELLSLDSKLRSYGSCLIVKVGHPVDVFRSLLEEYKIASVFTNRDYEPYATTRDKMVEELLIAKGVRLITSGDQLIFEPGEVLKPDGKPYEVFTPFSKRWLELYRQKGVVEYNTRGLVQNFKSSKANDHSIPSLKELGFNNSGISFPPKFPDIDLVINYADTRDIPSLDATTRIGLHLRFGTVSIRQYVKIADEYSTVWLNELIWREFFMHILAFYPHVVNYSFKKQYDAIKWVNDEELFQRWCEGQTGFPMVDAGMRQLKETGFMHNRVRMVAASLLIKHLLTDWRWGEQWFADHLLDFELSSNNGNWQWAAGSGCDAAPYFRIFNPARQQERFDPEFRYVKKWVPEYGTSSYTKPIIDHDFARKRCIDAYSKALKG